MNIDNLKLPLKENKNISLSVSRDYGNYRSNKLLIFAGIALLVVNVSPLIMVSVLTSWRVKNLENEVARLKNSINQVKVQCGDVIACGRIGKNHNVEEPEKETQTVPTIFEEPPMDPVNENEYDQLNEFKGLYHQIAENSRTTTNLNKGEVKISRTKRNIVAPVQERGISISESYRPSWEASKVLDSPSLDKYLSSDNERVDNEDDYNKNFRKIVKKSIKSRDISSFSEEGTSSPDFTTYTDFGRRRYRQRHLSLENVDDSRTRMGRVRLPAIHYEGDTSKYVVGQHDNFKGNGHLKHPQRTFVDWKARDWASPVMDAYFALEDGILTIKESGIYFVYAQIYYLDEHDTTGFRVYKNRETILQCTVTIHARERRLIGNTCYTAGVEYFSDGDTISLADITDGRYSLFEPGKSFFGVIKLSDIKIK